ncbi:hypothetical protein [Legionella clemsonensis]|uniref:Inverse autotransporter beta-domain domain-containing protein n=1 Tax=Legionella clemsonensis TaxID=1867846 RepID=A0A222P5Y9_9GAMM|nr:hypothetical protein [Legionella clemsonensis]ASQ47266.1 hypothetical protein clem_13695 [Legionella clemsonensis]
MIFSHARTSFLCSLLFLNLPSFAAGEIFPLPARLLGDGTVGSTAGSRGDVMVPLFGSEREIVYGDVQGKYYRDDSWFSGIAGGLRQAFGPYILGAYLFADRSESTSNKHFWSLNPGIEGMNAQWDAHLNGYFPVGSRSKAFRSAWADELGDYRFVSFSGHKQFDHILVDTETAGRGVDAEIGYRVLPFNNLRLALGGYYFNFQSMNDMRGIIGTIEYPFNERVTVLAQDAYDNLHKNTFLLTVRLRLGQINPQEGRLLEPIRRNLGTLDSGTSIPTERAWIDSGVNLVEKDHIWFFKPGGEAFDPAIGLANCTAESPCNTQLTQFEIDTINILDPNSTLDLATGDYLLDPTGDGRLALHEGQSIDGRTDNFIQPAYGEQMPQLWGGLDLPGFNNVSNIALDNPIEHSMLNSEENLLPSRQTIQTVGERITGTNVNNRNLRVGLESPYDLGVDIINNSNAQSRVTLEDAVIFALSSVRTATALRANNTNLTLIRGALVATAINTPESILPVVATGVELNGQSALNMFNADLSITAKTTNSSIAPIMTAQGIAVNGASTFQITGLSRFNIRGTSHTFLPTIVQAMGINNNSSVLNTGTVANTTMNVSAVVEIGHAAAWGIRQPANRSVNLINVNIKRITLGTSTGGQDVGP